MQNQYTGVIYRCTHIPTGRCYVGQAFNFESRKYSHLRNAQNPNSLEYNNYFHRALRKYPESEWEWDVICVCYADTKESLKDMLNNAEVRLIKEHKAKTDGFNMTEGGEGSVGFKHTEESRSKISEALSGENHPMYGKHHTEESRRKTSESQKGEKCYLYGQKRPEDVCKKISIGRTGVKLSEDAKGNMALAHKKPIIQYSMDGNYIANWDSAKDAGEALCIDSSGITKCCKGRCKSTGGFKWMYKKDYEALQAP